MHAHLALLVADVAIHDRVLGALRLRLREGLVDGVLQRHDVAATPRPVLGDDELGLAVLDAIAERVGREAAEDDGVHGADARAREHRHDDLGHHAHVDGDPIALLDAERHEQVREAHGLAVQIDVRQRPRLSVLPLPHDRGLVLARRAEVPVEAALGDVQRGSREPLGVGELPLQRLGPRRAKDEIARLATPEGVGRAQALFVEPVVGLARSDAGLLLEGGAGLETSVLLEDALDGFVRHDPSRDEHARIAPTHAIGSPSVARARGRGASSLVGRRRASPQRHQNA
jgi:hypothetical protein